MSTRALRRLKAEREAAQHKEEEEEEEEEEERPTGGGRVANAFDALEISSEDEEAASPAEEEEESKEEESPQRGKAKKKKKGKRKSKKKKAEDDDEVLLAAAKAAAERAAASAPPQAAESGTSDTAAAAVAAFAVDVRRIDPEQEMAQRFGAAVAHADAADAAAAANAAAASRRHRRRDAASSQQQQQQQRRREPNTIVAPRPHWPRIAGGWYPVQEPIAKGTGSAGAFRYRMGAAYAQAQEAFERAARVHDLGGAARVVSTMQPYHADALLQLAAAHDQAGEHAEAEDLLERCIYSLQCGFHHAFLLNKACFVAGAVTTPAAEGGCNRTLLLALLRYARALARRGCPVSALEAAKLGLALDPSDPFGFLLLLDTYALRAGATKTVLALSSVVPQLPGPLFNAALAQKRSGEDGDDMLERAILVHPIALKLLWEKQEEPAKRQAGLLSRSLFAKEAAAAPEALQKVASIFAELNAGAWAEPDVAAWLAEHAAIAVARHEQQPENSERLALYHEYADGSRLAAVIRQIVASDLLDSAGARIPPEVLREALAAQWAAAEDDPAEPVPAPTGNILRLLLYTLIPWVPVPNAPFDPNYVPPPDPDSDSD